jgi:hypothetical protein
LLSTQVVLIFKTFVTIALWNSRNRTNFDLPEELTYMIIGNIKVILHSKYIGEKDAFLWHDGAKFCTGSPTMLYAIQLFVGLY